MCEEYALHYVAGCVVWPLPEIEEECVWVPEEEGSVYDESGVGDVCGGDAAHETE